MKDELYCPKCGHRMTYEQISLAKFTHCPYCGKGKLVDFAPRKHKGKK